MFRFSTDFLRHRLFANSRHGIHSPFVYHLVDKVIYNYEPLPLYEQLERLRHSLLQDARVLHITDPETTICVDKKNVKTVSEIAKSSMNSPRLAQLIYRLSNAFAPAFSIELGTCLGIYTAYLAKSAPGGRLISISDCPETSAVAKETAEKGGISNVTFLTGNIDTLFPEVIGKEEKTDLVFISGCGRKEDVLCYFNLCLPKLHENSLLIFTDIYKCQEMKAAWAEIKAHPDVTLTIDLFWIGLVLFRKGRRKEHFRIRY